MQKFVFIPLANGKKCLNELFDEGWALVPDTFRIVPDYPRVDVPKENGRTPRIHVIAAVLQKD